MSLSAASRPPHVAVLVPASSGWGRGIIRGIASFAARHGAWHLHVEADGERRPLPHGWRGDAIIARLSTPAVARDILRLGVPVVNVSGIEIAGPASGVPRVCNDLRASGALAAAHFRDRGFRHVGYVGPAKLAYVREHRDSFLAAIAGGNTSCHEHALGSAPARAGRPDTLLRWLAGLPKPIGILSWNNVQGRAVIHACRRGGLLVPEDVAVLSGDDDPLLCESCGPPLSAIAVAAERIGERAAELVWLRVAGRPLPPTPITIAPLGIHTRQSTDTLAIGDPDLVRAMGFIREHAASGIHVADILRVVPLSRRSLERGFQTILGRSPAEEIRRIRLERAKHLLATTDLPVPKVAQASGFGTGEYLATIFRQATGITPLKYRMMTKSH